MKFSSSTIIASAAAILAIGAFSPASSPASAADLGGYYGGSIKDIPVPQEVIRAQSNPCYVRADVGYSNSIDPNVKWPVLNPQDDDGDSDHTEAEDTDHVASSSYYAGSKVSDVSIEDSWLVEGGLGCSFGQTSRAFRVEAVIGYRGERKIEGEPVPYIPFESPPVEDDPLHTSVTSYTAMINVYKDLGQWHGFTPYVGAGIGVAYHDMSETYYTLADGSQNPHFPSRQLGNSDIAFAWSLMAGVGYQISDRTTIDFGYRYIDLGEIESQNGVQSGTGSYPKVEVEDLTAHEFKVGLRYGFGSSGDCCNTGYALK